ncbi:MAG TPA: hypothetical protein VET48_04850 [Steroidobacteraceae bacterium]|nr:hypothetical protein [Steroidobacteraceae bacterium]
MGQITGPPVKASTTNAIGTYFMRGAADPLATFQQGITSVTRIGVGQYSINLANVYSNGMSFVVVFDLAGWTATFLSRDLGAASKVRYATFDPTQAAADVPFGNANVITVIGS